MRSRDQWHAYLAHEVAVRVGEADGDDVGLELDAGLHLQQRDVVLVGELVEVAVRHNLLHPSGKNISIDEKNILDTLDPHCTHLSMCL